MRPFMSSFVVLTDEHVPGCRTMPAGGVVLTVDNDPQRVGSVDLHFESPAAARRWLATAQASLAEIAPADGIVL